MLEKLYKVGGLAILLLIVLSFVSMFYFFDEETEKNAKLALRVKQLEPIAEADLLKQSHSTLLITVKPGRTLAASEEFCVGYIYSDEGRKIAILENRQTRKSLRCALTSDFAVGDVLWWDIMDRKNILYRRSRESVIQEMMSN